MDADSRIGPIKTLDKENKSPDNFEFYLDENSIEPFAIQNGNVDVPDSPPEPPTQSTPKNRKTYPLTLKIDALDFFAQNGKKAFWKKFRGQFDSKAFSKWKSNERKLRTEFKNLQIDPPYDQILTVCRKPVIPKPSLEPATSSPTLEKSTEPAISRSSLSPIEKTTKSANPKKPKTRSSSPRKLEETPELKKLPETPRVKKLNHLTIEQRTAIGTFITENQNIDTSAIIQHFIDNWSARIPKYIIKNVQLEVQKLDEVESSVPPLEIKYEESAPKPVEPTDRKRPRVDSPLSYIQKRFRNDSISSLSSLSSFPDTCSTSSEKSTRGRPSKSALKLMQSPRPSEKYKVLDFTALAKNDTLSVCAKCELKDDVEICQGVCKRKFHNSCFESSSEKLCIQCKLGGHNCFDCNELIFTQSGNFHNGTSELINPEKDVKCSDVNCGKYYHLSCMLKHKYSKYDKKSNSWTCPHHECKCCAKKSKENPVFSMKKNRSLLKCTRCPASYHQDVECIPAGTFLIGGKYIICPRHFSAAAGKSLHRPIHSNSCFVCNGGGELIICDGCPAAYHRHCATGDPETGNDDFWDEVEDENTWYCPYCKSDNQIMYNDLLWTKAGNHRWWPSLVIPPSQIPANVFKLKSGPGEFVIRYLGTNEYNWMYRGRCFPYRGKEDDPHMVAVHHKEAANQKAKRNAKLKQFCDGLVEAEEMAAQRFVAQTSTTPFRLIKGMCFKKSLDPVFLV